MSTPLRFYQWFYQMLDKHDYSSLRDFCSLNGISISVVSRYLNELRPVPVAFVVILSDAFNVPVQDVIAEMNPQHRYRFHTKTRSHA